MLLPRVANVPPWLRRPKDPRWTKCDPKDLKYIDDGMNIATINMKQVALCFEEHPSAPIKKVHLVESQAMLDHVTNKAITKGMVVNDAKTGLLCISASTSYRITASLNGRGGEIIKDRDSLKTLGYHLDSD